MEDDQNYNESSGFISKLLTKSLEHVPDVQDDSEDTEILNQRVPVSAQLPSFDCEAEGLKYVAGYVASFFLDKFPELGQKTSNSTTSLKNSSPWITALSRGGLIIPSEQFMAQVYRMESIFKSIHANSISFEPKIIQKLHQVFLLEFPNLSSDVLKKYARTRTFIRIKFLNWQNKLIQVY